MGFRCDGPRRDVPVGSPLRCTYWISDPHWLWRRLPVGNIMASHGGACGVWPAAAWTHLSTLIKPRFACRPESWHASDDRPSTEIRANRLGEELGLWTLPLIDC